MTESLSNQHHGFVYDIEFRQEDHPLGKPYVRTHVSGTMNIRTDVTHEDPNLTQSRNLARKHAIQKERHYG